MNFFQCIKNRFLPHELRAREKESFPAEPVDCCQKIEPGCSLVSRDNNYPGEVEALKFHPANTPFVCRHLGRPMRFDKDVWECWYDFCAQDYRLVYIEADDLEAIL